ncbi:MAG TPA: hypothetical protein VMR21_07725 [Vicinamibacteria bacterium]|nr:hypothetical protein [Vicinamibacteria bacterium]
MILAERVYQHPYQASEVHLVVYEKPAGTSPVEGMPDEAGYLVTEEWRGAGKVVKTLGFYPDRQAALERLQRRAKELELQRYRPVAPAA